MCKQDNNFRKMIVDFDKEIANETDPIKKEWLISLKLASVIAIVSKEMRNE